MSDVSVDEGAALSRLRRGDIGGLEALVQAYQAQAVRTAYLVIRNRAVAEEVVQEAFVRAFERVSQLDPTRPFGPWFLRSVVNVAVRAAERESRLARLPSDGSDVFAGSDHGPEAFAVAEDERRTVWAALGEITPGQRAAVVLRYFLGLELAESADRMGVPTGAVKRRLHDARRRLRALLSSAVSSVLSRPS